MVLHFFNARPFSCSEFWFVPSLWPLGTDLNGFRDQGSQAPKKGMEAGGIFPEQFAFLSRFHAFRF